MSPKFLYFDLGNVILNFSHRRACEQMGAVAGVTAEKVWQVVFESGLEQRFEAGEVSNQQFHDEFCRGVEASPDYNALLQAGSEIFDLNAAIVPLLSQLRSAGYRMGILSNTCGPHWEYCSQGRYGVVSSLFDVFALSYKIGACKPDAKIFAAAADLAGVAPSDIFFTDDIPKHVEGALAVGYDAVQYTAVPQLVEDLRSRGLRFNY